MKNYSLEQTYLSEDGIDLSEEAIKGLYEVMAQAFNYKCADDWLPMSHNSGVALHRKSPIQQGSLLYILP